MSIRSAHRLQATGGVAQDSQTLAFDGSGNPVGSVDPQRPCCRPSRTGSSGTCQPRPCHTDHESVESGPYIQEAILFWAPVGCGESHPFVFRLRHPKPANAHGLPGAELRLRTGGNREERGRPRSVKASLENWRNRFTRARPEKSGREFSKNLRIQGTIFDVSGSMVSTERGCKP